MSQNSDSCRKEQLFGLWAKKGHPMGKFMWGKNYTVHFILIRKGQSWII